MKFTQKFGTIFVSDSSSYKDFIVFVKREFKRTSLRRPETMLDTASTMLRKEEKVLSCGEKKSDGKLGQKNESLEEIKRYGPRVVRDGIPIPINEMARAAHVAAHRSLTAIFISELVQSFKLRILKIILATLPSVAAENSETVLVSEMKIMFVKSKKLMRNVSCRYCLLSLISDL